MKLVTLSILVALTLSVSGVAQAKKVGPAAKTKDTTGNVCTEDDNGSLTLRSQPGRGYKALAMIPNGTHLVITDTVKDKSGDNWYRVRYGKKVGWVRYDYVCFKN